MIAADIGEGNDVHPLNKEGVGKRLALAAQQTDYGNQLLLASGIVYQSMKADGVKVVLHFTHAGSGLLAGGKDTEDWDNDTALTAGL